MTSYSHYIDLSADLQNKLHSSQFTSPDFRFTYVHPGCFIIPSIIIIQKDMSELKISNLLQRPLTAQQWPQLQTIMKLLNEYINHCIKNREYIQAQKAKDKITEAQQQIRKRNLNDIELREQRAVEDMIRKHEEESAKINKEYEVGRRKIEVQFEELINKKLERQQLEKEKHLQQIQIALPHNNSPNKQLIQLRHEEEECVRLGNFMEAQRIKVEITRRQQELSGKNRKLRESNIKVMMGELEHKHRAEIELLEFKREEKLAECKKKHTKKDKQLVDKQERQIKELHWIYGEQKKRFK